MKKKEVTEKLTTVEQIHETITIGFVALVLLSIFFKIVFL